MLVKIKLKIFIVALVAVCMAFLNNATLAYYSTLGKTTNVVTSGNIRFIIHETTDQGKEFPEEGVFIVPGDIVSKKVNIESVCKHPFYLRVKMVYGIDSKELSVEDCFKLNINEEYWELHNGWYYYKNIVNPDEITPDVFSQVEIVGSQVSNSFIGETLKLTVKAQAVQSKNNPLENGKTYSASGWPKE